MDSGEFVKIAARLMSHPAAPGYEHAVRAEAEAICREHGLAATHDAYGNLIVRLATHSGMRPLVLSAHLDHPAFEIIRPLGRTSWLARFLGGVADRYFRSGVPLRLMPGGIGATLRNRTGAARQFRLDAKILARTDPQFAVWDLPEFKLRRDRIHGRACDDLIGVAAILATMADLKRRRAKVNVIGVISRAEEIGFLGALALAASRVLPRNSLVISLETSRELPPAKMGAGVIVRVGDRASIFNSEATRYLSEVAGAIAKKDKSFQWQRALMSGGTCEATAYQEMGFQTTAVCVALGNYHNCTDDGKIAEEYVSLSDACGMVRLLTEAAREMGRYKTLVACLPERLAKLRREAVKKLIQ